MVWGRPPEVQSYYSGQAILENPQGCEVWIFPFDSWYNLTVKIQINSWGVDVEKLP